jgi:hypothetical protein
MKALKSVVSTSSVEQTALNQGLKEMFNSLGFEVIPFAEAEKQAALKEVKKPAWCDCDPIVNGRTGRICQTHLFESFRKYLKEKKS